MTRESRRVTAQGARPMEAAMEKRTMKKTVVSAAIVLAAMLGILTPSWAQAGQAWPVPSVDPARDVPGVKEVPDATTDYKVLFDVGTCASADESGTRGRGR